MKKKFFFKYDFRNISETKAIEYLEKHIFSTEDFNRHIKTTSEILNIHESVIRDVVQYYITSVFLFINKTQKLKTKINIYGFFSLFIEKGRRI